MGDKVLIKILGKIVEYVEKVILRIFLMILGKTKIGIIELKNDLGELGFECEFL